MNDFLVVARITSISGSEGFLNLQILTDFPQKLPELKEVYLDFFGSKKKFVVEKIKCSNKSWQIKFRNFNSQRELNVLINREIFIDINVAAKLPDGSYFVHDLIDMEVWQENTLLGKVTDILKVPANDIFVIADEFGNERLIPFIFSFIDKIEAENRKIFLKPGAGEYEDDEN